MTTEDVEEITRIIDRWYARGVTGLTDGDVSILVRAYFELRAQIIHHSCGPRDVLDMS